MSRITDTNMYRHHTRSNNQITDAGVVNLCQALQTPTCKVATLDLSRNQISDAGVFSLCQALQTATCKVTTLNMWGNQITDAGVVSLCQASMSRSPMPVLSVYVNITDTNM